MRTVSGDKQLMNPSQQKESCPVCGGADTRDITRMKNMPLFCNFLYGSAEEAQAAPMGDIELVFCLHCSHMYNRAFNPDIVTYRPGYENSLHHSNRYRTYAEQQVLRLLKIYTLHNQSIIDIGCGSGEFLRLFTGLGSCTGTGFEPSADPAMNHDRSAVDIIADTFSEKYFHIPAKCYVSRHVLEHLPDPAHFLQTVCRGMEGKNAVLFLEVPDGAYMLEHSSVWDIIYEHCSYFTPLSLQYLLEQAGFRFAETSSGFGGQYLYLDAFPLQNDSRMEVPLPGKSAIQSMAGLAEDFALCSREKIQKVTDLLQEELENGEKIVLWGAGSKGVTLLNQVPDTDKIPYIVDINPAKQGKYLPGSGQLVVAPDFLLSHQVDTVFIMNDIYRHEIQSILESLHISTRIKSL